MGKDGKQWAVCKFSKSILPGDTKKNGTNPLKRHLESKCPKYKPEMRKKT